MRDYKNMKPLPREFEYQRIKGALCSFIHSGNYSTAKEALEAFIQKNQTKCEPDVLMHNIHKLLKVAQRQVTKEHTDPPPQTLETPKKKKASAGLTLIRDITLEEWSQKHPPSKRQ